MKTRIIIPARLSSTRLSKKLIRKIDDKMLIEHIILRAKKIKSDSLIVATDDRKIQKITESTNTDCWFSKKIFLNGTHRIASLSKEFKYHKNDIVINIQADEFNFSLDGISKMITYMKKSTKMLVSTLVYKNANKNTLKDENSVKVLLDENNYALVFSRFLSPFSIQKNPLIHLGIYGYRVSALNIYPKLPISIYEKYEKLEQLRFLWNNIKIKCILLNNNKSISVNSLKDLKAARKSRT
ncbi:MAG: 3-deoxy-manno-octulosonate cytidylyltransferase [Pseudomonadota bacterium]|nr:3-deoxy-manno-octulosonate cytidylyltransferase [Pseudomonadota bacterium]